MAKLYVNHSKINFYEFFFQNKARKTYTNAGISLILIVVLLIFALRPTVLTIGKIREKIKQYDELNDKVETKVEAAQMLAQQKSLSSADYAGGMKDEIDFLDNVFFGRPDIKLFYKNLYERAESHQVAIKAFTPKYSSISSNAPISPDLFDHTSGSPSMKFFEVSMTFEAKTITQIEGFLSTLEGYTVNPILSRLKDITVNNLTESTNASQSQAVSTVPEIVNCNATLLIYIDETESRDIKLLTK